MCVKIMLTKGKGKIIIRDVKKRERDASDSEFMAFGEKAIEYKK